MDAVNENVVWPGWKTIKLIGQGSYGSVYEIERDVFGQIEKAALKVISIPQNGSDIDDLYSEGYDAKSITNTFSEYLKDIVAEYSLMRKMNGSANVVNCDDIRYIQHNDGVGWDIFIKMELLTPLSKTITQDIDESQVIRIGMDICKALILCKKNNIIHRDIKPANIFVSENGDYKLGDFGIAKTVEKTCGGTKIGTYDYMAPEIYHDQPYGRTADIYSLGMVLYWLLNERRTPFLPLPPSLPTTSEKELARKRRFSGESLPSPARGSRELIRIVLKACAYDPNDRYDSAEIMFAELQKLIPEASTHSETFHSEEDVPDDTDTIGIFHQTRNSDREQNEAQSEEGTIGIFSGKRVEAKNGTKLSIKKKLILAFSILLLVALTITILVNSFSDKVNVPSDRIVNVYATYGQTICLKADGTVLVAGEPIYEEYDVSAWTDIKAIAFGAGHIVGLKADGTVVADGENYSGQCDVESWTNIKAIAACYCVTVGLRDDGTVVVAGELPYTTVEKQEQYYSSWTNVEQIHAVACGEGRYVFGLRKDGRAYGGPSCDGWENIVDMSSSGWLTLGLKKDGTVVACGTDYSIVYAEICSWSDISRIYAGDSRAIGLRKDGTVALAGYFDNGIAEQIQQWTGIEAIYNIDDFPIGLKKDGSVVTVSSPREHSSFDKDDLKKISSWTDIKKIAIGANHIVGLKRDGTLVFAGDNDYGQCDISPTGVNDTQSQPLSASPKPTASPAPPPASVKPTTAVVIPTVPPVETSNSSTLPSDKDLSDVNANIRYPLEDSYLSQYQYGYIAAPGGIAVNGYKYSSKGEGKEIVYKPKNGEAVTILAVQNGRACIIVDSTNTACWVNNDYIDYA